MIGAVINKSLVRPRVSTKATRRDDTKLRAF